MIDTLKNYYNLTKPGIIYGNLLTVIGGFLLASKGRVDFFLFFATIFGVALVIGAGCVYNNYLDRSIDKKMARTKKRALVSGIISAQSALAFATALGISGFSILYFFVNIPTVIVGLIGFVFYVVIYGISKRQSVHGTIVGSVAGAGPVVAGYVAVSGQFDLGALLLFTIMAFWQMPHFYAIAMFRLSDYKAANIPVLPSKKGMRTTKIQIMIYTLGFMTACVALTIYDYTGIVFASVMTLLGCVWLYKGLQGFNTSGDIRWARKMFGFSLIVLLLFSLLLSTDVWLP